MSKKKALISVVIPAFNEREGILSTVATVAEEIRRGGAKAFEIIVVDDGSSDGTFACVQANSDTTPGLRGVALSRNFGKESALLAGLREAAGDCVITIDADLQHPPRLISSMLDQWRDGAAIVHAIKRDRSADSWTTRLRARAFNAVATTLGGVDIRHSSDFKLLDRQVVDLLTTSLHERERFYRGLASWVGFRQDRVLFDIERRREGQSKWSIRSLFELALTATLSFTSAPLRVVTVLGLITLLFAVVLICATLWSRVHGDAVSGFATIEITLLLLGSVIMVSLGVIGEYIAKIYDEVKGRPAYLVKERCGRASGAIESGTVQHGADDSSQGGATGSRAVAAGHAPSSGDASRPDR